MNTNLTWWLIGALAFYIAFFVALPAFFYWRAERRRKRARQAFRENQQQQKKLHEYQAQRNRMVKQ